MISSNFDESNKILYLIDNNGKRQNIPLTANESFEETNSPVFDRGNLVYDKKTFSFNRNIAFEFEYSGLVFSYNETLNRRTVSEETNSYNSVNRLISSTTNDDITALRNVDFLLPFFCGNDFILYSSYSDSGEIEHRAAYSSDSNLISVTSTYNNAPLKVAPFVDPSIVAGFVFRQARFVFSDETQIEGDNYFLDIKYTEIIKPYYFDKTSKTSREMDSSLSANMDIDIPVNIEQFPQTHLFYFGNREDNNNVFYHDNLIETLIEKKIVYYKIINGSFYEFKGLIIQENKVKQLDDETVGEDEIFNRIYLELQVRFDSITKLEYFHRNNYLIINPYSINGFCLFLNWANNRSGYVRRSYNNVYQFHRFLDYFEVFAFQNNLSSKGNKIFASHVDINSIKNKDGIAFVYVFEIIENQIFFKEVLFDKVFSLRIKDENFKDYAISYHPQT